MGGGGGGNFEVRFPSWLERHKSVVSISKVPSLNLCLGSVLSG